MKNIVLMGMPGCGKSTLGKRLARLLGMSFFDVDALIEAGQSRTITEIFANEGEGFFRELEAEAIRRVSKCHGAVIATGGGAVLYDENTYNLKKNGILVFIDRPIDNIINDIDTRARPLLAGGEPALLELYNKRLPIYLKLSDIHVVNDGTIDDAIHKISKEVQL